MRRWTRRQIATGAALMATFPHRGFATARLRVVVVGGGIGGATVAKYLAMSGAPISVTLIEPQTHYTTGIFSNLYLAGARSLASLTFGYEALADRYGVIFRQDRATAIDPDAKRVHLESGESLPYDRLVVSPGIAFEPRIDGYDDAAMRLMPHAWTDGRQMELLRSQLEAMDNGGTLVIAVPPAPYRAPRGPYERATMAAYYLKQFKPRSKVLVLDAKDDFIDKDLFQEAWKRRYPSMIEWRACGTAGWVGHVDPKTRMLRAAGETIKGDVVNIIPPQVAGALAKTAGLVDRTGWCPVDTEGFESTLYRGIYVVGDAAQADEMPKTGFSANSQAKACAFAILSDLGGQAHRPPHLLEASYTFLAGDDAVGEVVSFNPVGGKLKASMQSQPTRNADVRRNNVRDANRWYDAFMHDVLG